jgi:hypothetical protein
MNSWRHIAPVLAGVIAFPPTLYAQADQIPSLRLHQCVKTRIIELGSRLENMPDSGSAVTYGNGIYGVSYEMIRAVRASRVGDPVIVCLVTITKGCPKNDNRGRRYSAQNLRTGGKWTLPDAEHMCGGA